MMSGISSEGFGTVVMALNFIVSIVIIRLTPKPSKTFQDLVGNIRIPSNADEATH